MKFTVYSRNGCPYCSKVKQVLELSKLEHVIYKLGEDFNREGFYHQFGQGATFPQVVINDIQLIGGCTETVKYLKENNLV
tara:strand:+ start:390 stop:629 length:240 start_codon:yes stop_codon:yes gene_type:complete